MTPDLSNTSVSKHKSPFFALVLLALSAVVILLTIYIAGRRQPSDVLTPTDGPTLAQQVLARSKPLLAQQQYAAAVSLMKSYVDRHPNDVEVRPLLAEALIALNRHDQAEAQIDQVLLRAARQSKALWLKARLMRQRAAPGAMEIFRQAAESPDAEPEMLAAYGLELFSAGQAQDAKHYLQQARHKGLEDARILGALGELALRDEDFPQAEKLLSQAVTDPRSNGRHWAMLARAQKNNNHLEGAVESLQEGIKKFPADRGVLYMELGETLGLLHRKTEQAEAYALASTFDPLGAVAAFRAAKCYYDLGQYAQAKSFLDPVIALQPNDPDLQSWKKRIEDALARISRMKTTVYV